MNSILIMRVLVQKSESNVKFRYKLINIKCWILLFSLFSALIIQKKKEKDGWAAVKQWPCCDCF